MEKKLPKIFHKDNVISNNKKMYYSLSSKNEEFVNNNDIKISSFIPYFNWSIDFQIFI